MAFLEAAQKQLATFGMPAISEPDVRTKLAKLLGLKTGASLDLDRPAGLVVSLASTPLSAPEMALFFSVSSLELRNDLAQPLATGAHSEPIADEGDDWLVPLTTLEVFPGGIAAVTHDSYIDAIQDTLKDRLAAATSTAPPAVSGTIDVGRLTATYVPFLEMELGASGSDVPPTVASFMRTSLDLLKSNIGLVRGSWAPGGPAIVGDLEIDPIAGSGFATLLADPSAAPLAPTGTAVPADLPLVFSTGVSPAAIALFDKAVNGLFTDAGMTSAMTDLISQCDGTAYGGLGLDGVNSLRFFWTAGYADIGKAKDDMRQVLKGSQALYTGLGVQTSVKVSTDAMQLEKIPVDRVTTAIGTGDPPTVSITQLLACAGHVCGMALGAEAQDDLDGMLKEVADPTTPPTGLPLTARPGVKETVAELGDVSHGFIYADIARLVALAGSPTAPATPPQPGLGMTWSTSHTGLRLRVALELAPLATVVTAMGME
jgi:hypothetical protein